VADREVLSPASPRPDILIAFNAPSLARFGPTVPPGGTILYDSSVIAEPPLRGEGVTAYGVPFTAIAVELGKAVVKNIVALGALCAATGIFPRESFLTVLRQALSEKLALLPLNEEAFSRGALEIERIVPRPQGVPS
jgi:Pyruvate/2-oxoacid:ferredoxin oxidoreductase gamma subunit